MSEKELLKRLRNKETAHEAFAELVKEYSERVYWQIRRMVISHDDANDILQDTFLKAWLNIDKFRGDSKIYTWLYRIATNESITFLNKKRRRYNISIDDDNSYLINTLEGDTYFDGDKAQKLLQEAILTLPDKQRLVFQMKYFEEMKYTEISEVLGTSVGALKASYHHAKNKIEDFLKTPR